MKPKWNNCLLGAPPIPLGVRVPTPVPGRCSICKDM